MTAIAITRAVLVTLLALTAPTAGATEPGPNPDGTIAPLISLAPRDYRSDRRRYHTQLLRRGPAPGSDTMPGLPNDAQEIQFRSGTLTLKAWMGQPSAERRRRRPAVIFLHGGFSFGQDAWDAAQPYRKAGFMLVTPILRGENGQQGVYSLFYNEVEDVVALLNALRRRADVDRRHIYLAGHSIGGTLALLASLASHRFKATASLSGSPDQAIFVKYGIDPDQVPFDPSDVLEVQLRSPLAYARSFRTPVLLIYGTGEPHFRLSSQKLASIARTVSYAEVEGDHLSAVPAGISQSIEFFRKQW